MSALLHASISRQKPNNEIFPKFPPNPSRLKKRMIRRDFKDSQSNFEEHANKIVTKMEEDETINSSMSEQLQTEAIRDLPQSLSMKRCVKTKLAQTSNNQKSKKQSVNCFQFVQYHLKSGFTYLYNSLELWNGTLKDIEGHFGSGYTSYFTFLRWLFLLNLFLAVPLICFVVVPQIAFDGMNTNNNTEKFHFSDIFVGEGHFRDTLLYYGHFTNSLQIGKIPYDFPAAYFAVVVICYFISFVILSVSVATSYRRTFIETKGGYQNIYANKIFCGWDYSIATEEAAMLKKSSIYFELKELLTESMKMNNQLKFSTRFLNYCLQIIINFIIALLIGGLGYGVWLLLKSNYFVLAPTLTVNFILLVVPTFFTYISKYEKYNNPRKILYINLTRTFVLGSVMISVIMTFWLSRADQKPCWETSLGAEMYRLIIYDFILLIILEPAYHLFKKFVLRKDDKSEFDIARHTLQLIYNQTLFWVSLLYSPILPIIVTLKMLIIWYVRKLCLKYFNKPPKKTWRAANAQTWFLMFSFVCILLIIAVQGYTLKSIATSSSCGPFRDYNFMYVILTRGITDLENMNKFTRVILFFTRPGVVAFILIGLGMLVYYLKEKALNQSDKVAMLREMLAWQAKDKKYLMLMYMDVTKNRVSDGKLHDNHFIDPRDSLPNVQVHVEDLKNYSTNNQPDFNERFKEYF